MYLVIAYDVCTETRAGEKRLRRVAKVCEAYGQRVQKSVFECIVDESGYLELLRRLSQTVHPSEDSVRIYRVNDFSKKTVHTLGREMGIDFEAPLVL